MLLPRSLTLKAALLSLLALLIANPPSHAADHAGYLFVTFRGEASPWTEQIYFLTSTNGHDWTAINQGKPSLVSSIGEKGVRDPFILRKPDQSGFYLIATDLSIHLNGDWNRAQTAASKSIVVWESPDLLAWSKPNLVKVAPDNAGCTWAPEAIYDAQRHEYLVFWASKTADDHFQKHRIWAAHTRDFKSFSSPFVYIEKPTTVIDTTIIRENDTYYRFTKDELYKAITMERSNNLMTGWKNVDSFSLAKLKGYEGPACFMIAPQQDKTPAKWCLLLDYYSRGKGYQPYETQDLALGQFVPSQPMNFPFNPIRHGTVLPITQDELNQLNAL